jgi:hypothetical protein
MNTYRIAATTRAGDFIQTEFRAETMSEVVKMIIYELAVGHGAQFNDVVELDITELE